MNSKLILDHCNLNESNFKNWELKRSAAQLAAESGDWDSALQIWTESQEFRDIILADHERMKEILNQYQHWSKISNHTTMMSLVLIKLFTYISIILGIMI